MAMFDYQTAGTHLGLNSPREVSLSYREFIAYEDHRLEFGPICAVVLSTDRNLLLVVGCRKERVVF